MKMTRKASCKNKLLFATTFGGGSFTDKSLKTLKNTLSSSISFPFVILLISLCFCLIPSSSSAESAVTEDHFQAKPSLDSDENIGKGIDEWPSSDGSSDNAVLPDVKSNSTVNEQLIGNSQEIANVTISSTNSSTNASKVLSEEEEDELEWRDENRERRSHTRVAAVAVYGSVILIALFGVLIKYFVTQYETLQAKAQLEYQQLRNI